MLDTPVRAVLAGPLDRVAAVLDRPWITPDRITMAGLVLGLGSAAAAAASWWGTALVLWLVSRAADGLDGPLARRRNASGVGRTSKHAGGFLDITADFVVYGAFVVGVGLGWGGSLAPFLAVLLTYYLNGTAFLAFSSIAERTGHTIDDGRSLSFLGGLAEGTETIIVHSLWVLLPGVAGPIAWCGRPSSASASHSASWAATARCGVQPRRERQESSGKDGTPRHGGSPRVQSSRREPRGPQAVTARRRSRHWPPVPVRGIGVGCGSQIRGGQAEAHRQRDLGKGLPRPGPHHRAPDDPAAGSEHEPTETVGTALGDRAVNVGVLPGDRARYVARVLVPSGHTNSGNLWVRERHPRNGGDVRLSAHTQDGIALREAAVHPCQVSELRVLGDVAGCPDGGLVVRSSASTVTKRLSSTPRRRGPARRSGGCGRLRRGVRRSPPLLSPSHRRP